MEYKKYFSSGEIVKYTGITKDALFHYEKNNLVKPEIIKENGYRFYTSDQFDLINSIVILRNVGVSIAEIKEFLEKQTLDKLYTLYDEKEKEIDKQIKLFKETKNILKSRKNNITAIKKAEIGVVSKEYMDEIRIELSQELSDNEDFSFNEAVSDLMLRSHSKFRFNNTGGIVSIDFESSKQPRTKCLYIENKKSKEIKPKGEYLVIYHKGYFENVNESYMKLYEYTKENNIEIEKDIYEEIMLEHIAMTKDEPFIMKIMAKTKE